jgi:hypothetical protein
MSMEEIRNRSGKFEGTIYWRNAREYVAALVVVVFFGFEFWRVPDVLTRVGYGLMIAGMLYLSWQLHRRGSSRTMPAELGLATGLEFFRRELERQRTLVENVWTWYLGPLIPGWVVLTAAFARTNPGHMRHIGLFSGVLNLIGALSFVAVWKMNQRAARRLQRRIDELDALQGQRSARK